MTVHVRGLVLIVAVMLAPFQALRAANPDQVQQLRETRQCPSCDLTAATLSGLVLSAADLRRADLSRANLYKVRLNDANLEGATLRGAKLYGTDLTGANLTDADLSGADLRGSSGAHLAKAKTDAATICPNGARGPCIVK